MNSTTQVTFSDVYRSENPIHYASTRAVTFGDVYRSENPFHCCDSQPPFETDCEPTGSSQEPGYYYGLRMLGEDMLRATGYGDYAKKSTDQEVMQPKLEIKTERDIHNNSAVERCQEIYKDLLDLPVEQRTTQNVYWDRKHKKLVLMGSDLVAKKVLWLGEEETVYHYVWNFNVGENDYK